MINDINNLPEGFISGLIAGSLATAFGFTLTLLWDIYKDYKINKKRDEAISLALHQEIQSNIDILYNNKRQLKHELKIIKDGSTILNPLTPLQNQMWSAVIINMPNKLIKNQELLTQLREAVQAISIITETINSRENWRANETTNTGFITTLKSYDEIISKDTSSLIEMLETLVQEF